LVSTTRVNCSSDIRMISVSSVMPAFATSTSTGPSSPSTAVNAASTASASVTSHRTPYRPSGASLPRWVTATRSPWAANARAMARPIPRLPPVTSTVRATGPPHCRRSVGSERTSYLGTTRRIVPGRDATLVRHP
jgi:hypothetical protein